jgi:hypothetical protein
VLLRFVSNQVCAVGFQHEQQSALRRIFLRTVWLVSSWASIWAMFLPAWVWGVVRGLALYASGGRVY